ncbi:MAG: hypothetical protein UHG68_06290 [Clostridia bacterium]|nr:hypothetical protein [Clostridia bacterium]
MKNKAFLPLLEQLCMILIFSIACTICLQVFLHADNISKDRDSQDEAVVIAQNAAELLKGNGGDLNACAQALSGISDEGTLIVFYDKKCSPVDNESNAELKLIVTKKETSSDLIECAQVEVIKNAKTIFELEVYWQAEVKADES